MGGSLRATGSHRQPALGAFSLRAADDGAYAEGLVLTDNSAMVGELSRRRVLFGSDEHAGKVTCIRTAGKTWHVLSDARVLCDAQLEDGTPLHLHYGHPVLDDTWVIHVSSGQAGVVFGLGLRSRWTGFIQWFSSDQLGRLLAGLRSSLAGASVSQVVDFALALAMVMEYRGWLVKLECWGEVPRLVESPQDRIWAHDSFSEGLSELEHHVRTHPLVYDVVPR